MQSEMLPASPATRGDDYICGCLKITRADLVRAVADGRVRSFADLRARTGAGDGCTSCHRRLRACLDEALARTSG